MTDMREIQRMTLYEYQLRIKAWNLRRIDQEYFIAKQAWMNREIDAQRKKGKGYEYVYKTFKKFFDYEKQERQIIDGASKPASTVTSRWAEYLRKKKQNE